VRGPSPRAALLGTLKSVGRAPKQVVLFGVELEQLEVRLALSQTVAARVPELCADVLAEHSQPPTLGWSTGQE
jgi:hypothetical protein